jgi:hypothetical protein
MSQVDDAISPLSTPAGAAEFSPSPFDFEDELEAFRPPADLTLTTLSNVRIRNKHHKKNKRKHNADSDNTELELTEQAEKEAERAAKRKSQQERNDQALFQARSSENWVYNKRFDNCSIQGFWNENYALDEVSENLGKILTECLPSTFEEQNKIIQDVASFEIWHNNLILRLSETLFFVESYGGKPHIAIKSFDADGLALFNFVDEVNFKKLLANCKVWGFEKEDISRIAQYEPDRLCNPAFPKSASGLPNIVPNVKHLEISKLFLENIPKR